VRQVLGASHISHLPLAGAWCGREAEMVAGEEELAGPEQYVVEASENPARTASDEEAGGGGASRRSRLRRPPRGACPVLLPVESGTAGDVGAIGNMAEGLPCTRRPETTRAATGRVVGGGGGQP
jgi:hypothetical protein